MGFRWGELEGGKVTRSQLPVGCRIDDLDDPRCVWGGPNWGVSRRFRGVLLLEDAPQQGVSGRYSPL